MLKKGFLFIIAFSMILCVTACSKQRPDVVVTSDLQSDGQFADSASVVKTEDGYYYLTQDGSDKLMFYDAQTAKSVVVCNKVNCSHKDGDASCNACFTSSVNFYYGDSLTYYDGSLYMVHNNKSESGIATFYLTKVSIDGSQREDVLELCNSTNEMLSILCEIYNGYIYYTVPDVGSLEEGIATLSRKKLKNSSEEEIVFEYKGLFPLIQSIKGFGGHIYFQAVAMSEKEEQNFYGDLYSYDIATNQTSLLIEASYRAYTFVDDMILYDDIDNIKSYNLKTKEEDIFLNEGNIDISYDGKYIYIDNWLQFLESDDYTNRSIRIFDLNGSLIDEIPFPHSDLCYFGDSEYLFAEISEYTDSNRNIILNMFDKSQIGTGKYEWIPLKE